MAGASNSLKLALPPPSPRPCHPTPQNAPSLPEKLALLVWMPRSLQPTVPKPSRWAQTHHWQTRVLASWMLPGPLRLKLWPPALRVAPEIPGRQAPPTGHTLWGSRPPYPQAPPLVRLCVRWGGAGGGGRVRREAQSMMDPLLHPEPVPGAGRPQLPDSLGPALKRNAPRGLLLESRGETVTWVLECKRKGN